MALIVWRSEGALLAGAGLFAVLMPVVLIGWTHGGVPAAPSRRSVPIEAPATPPPLVAVYERPLFAAPASAGTDTAADAPQLVGIVGRLGSDAVALVRTGDGQSRTLRIGESVDGWQLASLAIDAAFFTRGAQQVRVPLPAGD